MTWLDEIISQHKELESPINFWRWAALSAISAIVKDNVWIDRAGVYNLYPNIYVMLHADSGMKKGPPVNMAKRLVKYVNNTRIITGRSSIQGILKELGTTRTAPGGKILMKSNAFICSSELTSSIVDDKAAMEILTDLYDRHYNVDNWRSLLKSETFDLKDPTITMLTATNEAHSKEFFTAKDIQGGYFARTFVIFEKKRNVVNSLMDPLENPPQIEKMAEYLKQLAELKGPFELTPTSTPVGKFYNDWYRDFIAHMDQMQVEDPTGTLNRFGDSVLKVAMLYSLAEEPVLKISMNAMETAIKECEKLIGNIRRTTMGTGKSQWASHKSLVIEELVTREPHIITRRQLNKKYYLHGNADEWDNVIKSLEAAGILVIESAGNEVIYKMPDKIAEEWKKHLEGRMRK